jgi:hypothetical protein
MECSGYSEAQSLALDAQPSTAAVAEYDTDVMYEDLPFTKKGTSEQCWRGMPTCSSSFFAQAYHLIRLAASIEKHRVVIQDARKRNLDYEKCGFTLCPLKSGVTDWDQVALKGSDQQKLLFAQFESVIRELHPDVERIQFEGSLMRGGDDTNPPATNGLHLDFYPDMEKVKAMGANGSSDQPDDGLEMKMVLGLWMPREMANPVYDYPLFVGDASTFVLEDIVPQRQDFYHISEGQKQRVRNLAAGAPIYSPRQRWYYYHRQTCEELIIFRHLTEPAGGKACFHAAFEQPLPEGMETRKSFETRAFLHFAKSS